MDSKSVWYEKGELPPVGTVCLYHIPEDYYYNNDRQVLPKEGQKVTIVAHTKYQPSWGEVAVYTWVEEDEYGKLTGLTSSSIANYFKPIVTKDDIIADLLATIDDMVSLAGTESDEQDAVDRVLPSMYQFGL